MLEVIERKRIEKLPDYLTLITDSQEVEGIKEHLGVLPFDYDVFFIQVGWCGYNEVWGVEGSIPYLSRIADRLA